MQSFYLRVSGVVALSAQGIPVSPAMIFYLLFDKSNVYAKSEILQAVLSSTDLMLELPAVLHKESRLPQFAYCSQIRHVEMPIKSIEGHMRKLVIFSGAGMSAESGINTFRDSNGLWEQHDIHEVATPEAWAKNPALVQRFYNERRKNILAAQPNQAHQIIVDLQQNFDVQVITQNIDDLHERAGSLKVLHLHGNIRFAKSSGPGAQYSDILYPITGWQLDLEKDRCPEGYPLRPHVVWFGEAVPAYQQAVELVQDAEIFIVIGSTLSVYPVAGLIHHIPQSCQAYYIDPQADYQRVPQRYHLLKHSATQGMQQLQQILADLIDPA